MKLSPSQATIVNAVLSLIGTSFTLYISGLHPFFSTGVVNWPGIGAYSLAALVSLGAGIWGYIEAHPAQVVQAVEDSAQELHVAPQEIALVHQKLDALYRLVSVFFGQQQQQQGPSQPVPAQAPQATLQHPLATPVVQVARQTSVAPVSVPNPLDGLNFDDLTAPTQPRVPVVK